MSIPTKRVRTNLSNMTKEEILEHKRAQYKKYAIRWRERHPEMTTEKITCECGSEYTRNNRSTHRKSAKHKQLLQVVELTKKLAELRA